MTERAKELNSYFKSHKVAFLNVLQSLVEKETPSDDPNCFSSMFSQLRDEFEKLNYRVEHVADKQPVTSCANRRTLIPENPPS